MKLSSNKIKKFLIFSQKKAFIMFWEVELFVKLLTFQKGTFQAKKTLKSSEKMSYISGN